MDDLLYTAAKILSCLSDLPSLKHMGQLYPIDGATFRFTDREETYFRNKNEEVAVGCAQFHQEMWWEVWLLERHKEENNSGTLHLDIRVFFSRDYISRTSVFDSSWNWYKKLMPELSFRISLENTRKGIIFETSMQAELESLPKIVPWFFSERMVFRL